MADDTTLTVEFRPRLWEAFWASLVVLAGLSQLAIGAAFVFSKPETDFTCDRAKCQLVSHGLFGATDELTLDVAQLQNSRVDATTRQRHAWVVDSQGKRFEIGTAASDAALVHRYEQLAHDFQAFLNDPTRPAFTASYSPGGSPPVALFFAIGALLLAWGIKWRGGWKAKLVFDRSAGTVVIVQRPWARTRTFPLAEVSGIAASDRVAHTMYGNLRWEDIVLGGRAGKPLWRYRTMFTRKTYKHVHDSVRSIEKFLTRSG